MKTHPRLLSCLLLVGFPLLFSACQKEPAQSTAPAPAEASAADNAAVNTEVTLETLDQRVSYAVGRNFGNQIRNDQLVDVDANAVIAGLRDALSSAEAKMTDEEINQAFTEIRARAQEAQMLEVNAEKERAAQFLATNGQRSEVTTTGSGLQYEVLVAGDGPKPTPDDKVNVHYHGTLINGDVFDSSVQRGEPISFPVTGVIAGWVEALQLMPVGSKWKLYIPSDIAYGDRGSPPKIPGGAALIFEVELLGIDEPPGENS